MTVNLVTLMPTSALAEGLNLYKGPMWASPPLGLDTNLSGLDKRRRMCYNIEKNLKAQEVSFMQDVCMSYVPLWCRYLEKFDDGGLSNEDLGALTRAMLRYQISGEKPTNLSGAVQIFWMFIIEDLDRAKLQYTNSVNNGKKGGRPQKNPEEPNENPEQTQTNPEKPRTRTRTESKTKTETETRERTQTPAPAEGDLSVCEKTYGEFGWVKLTDEQYAQLKRVMGKWELTHCIAYIDRAAQTTNNRNHWKDWFVVLRRCYDERWHRIASRSSPVPTGASGHLGEAELEAIQRVLAEK